MPTYDYVCDACGHEFEHFQAMSDDVLTKCPECKKKKLRRLFGTGGAIMFKGSGFYITDYRSESYKSGQANDKKSSESCAERVEVGKQIGNQKRNAEDRSETGRRKTGKQARRQSEEEIMPRPSRGVSSCPRRRRVLTMICPVCDVVFESKNAPQASLPFCSARCKQIDLGRWLSERNPLSVQKRPSMDDLDGADYETDEEG
ncbi:MAG: DNA gyrase inhibitor YacG [Pirellulales bacterium]